MRARGAKRRLDGVSLTVLAAVAAMSGRVEAASATGGAFNGTPTVKYGSATIDRSVANVDTITATSSVTTINWVPYSSAVSGGSVDFLPTGGTGNFKGAAGATQPYTILNRIVNTDETPTSLVTQFNGALNSDANVRVWFYTPGGALIGPNARFNVGGLVLSTADPVGAYTPSSNPETPGTYGNFMPTIDQFSLAGTAGGTQSITISPGAVISATNAGQNNYVVMLAPKIAQNGTVQVNGSTALVAAESATFAVDSHNLFTITVDAGTTVASDTLTSTGTTGGTDAVADNAAQLRRVYMVAVPKNNAVTLAIASGGALGFDIAGAASMDGNTVVLSAGLNIADSVNGSPFAGAAGTGSANVTLTGANVTSRALLGATGTATVTAPATFSSSLSIAAPTASVLATGATLNVGGNLDVNASANPAYGAGAALVQVGSGGVVRTGTNGAVLSAGGVTGDLNVTADDVEYDPAGSAKILVSGGQINAAGSVLASAQALVSGDAVGGTAQIDVSAGGTLGAGYAVNADAGASGYYAQGGAASVTAEGAESRITAAGTGGYTLTANAGATAYGPNASGGGDGVGGTALIQASDGATISATGQGGSIIADASALGNTSYGNGGSGLGGSARIIAVDGTISAPSQDADGDEFHGGFIRASADGQGGGTNSSYSPGGNGTGGLALISTGGSSGTILLNATTAAGASGGSLPGLYASASGTGGSGGDYAGGGAGSGGTASITTTGSGQSIGASGGGTISAVQAIASGTGGNGGAGTGGTALIAADGGSITLPAASLVLDASGTGGASNNIGGGTATGGSATLRATGGGTLQIDGGATLTVAARGGATSSGGGGAATGGEIFIANAGGTLQLDGGNAGIGFDVSATPGTNADGSAAAFVRGDALVSATGGSATQIGSGAPQADGSLRIADAVTIAGNGRLLFSAAGDVDLSGSIRGTGNDVRLGLLADNGGTGTGTVHLAGGAVSLTGADSDIGIYYNPAGGFGNPDDYSPGIAAGTMRAFQLITDPYQLYQLSEIGQGTANRLLTQNFALGRDLNMIDSGGISPIGTTMATTAGQVAAPFTGNFDGLGHVISDLTVYSNNTYTYDPATNTYTFARTNPGTGLFGAVSTASGSVLIRDVGLIRETVYGGDATGGLIGQVAASGCAGCVLTVDNVFTTGSVQGNTTVGGLIGQLDGAALGSRIVTNAHSDATISAYNSSGNVGGLVGETSYGQFSAVFATGNVEASNYNAGSVAIQGVGGLVGSMRSGTITQAYATNQVDASASVNSSAAGSASTTGVGGLVGIAAAAGAGAPAPSITRSYAAGRLYAFASGGTGGAVDSVGGLIGSNAGTVDETYASTLTQTYADAGAATHVGGLVGNNAGTVTSSYWDSYTTGQANGVGAGSTGTAPSLFAVNGSPDDRGNSDYAFDLNSYGYFSDDWVTVAGQTRPIGRWELPTRLFGVKTVASAHQVQLIALDLGASYRLAHDIDLGDTNGLTDIWSSGFITIGSDGEGTATFTGTLSGEGRVLSNLTIDGYGMAGLIGINAGTISDVGLSQVSIGSGPYLAGALAAENDGTISDVFATGTITLSDGSSAGGLVGMNGTTGSISQAYATVAVSGAYNAGGLVGVNAGKIDQTYANGAVDGYSGAGGLVGDNSVGSATRSYFDSEATGQSAACGSGDCGGVTALTTSQTLMASSFPDFSIDTQGGQGLPWRQYDGQTTPLLERFLTPVMVTPSGYVQYNGETQTADAYAYGADSSHVFGTATTTASGRNVGDYSGYYTGGLYSDQRGYDLVPSSSPGYLTIYAAPLTLTASTDSRVYNATTASAGAVSSSGLQGTDSISGLAQTFDSRNAGARTLSVSSYTIDDGNDGHNYAVTLVSAAGTITPAPLTLAASSDTRTYNGTTASAAAVTASGLQGTDSISGLAQSFDSRNVGQRTLAVNSGYVVNDGNNGGNYTVTVTGATGSISQAALVLTPAADNRVYNATTASNGAVQTNGLQTGDTVANLSQSFDSANVGKRTLSVNPGYVVNDGNGGNNYAVSIGHAAGSITPAPLTLAAASETRVYDATTGSAGTAIASGLQGNDSVTGLSQSFDSRNAGSRTLTVNGGYAINDGNGGANYTVTLASAVGRITPATLTLTASPDSRVYDATTGSAGAVTASGLKGSDTVTGLVQAFDSPNAGSRTIAATAYKISDGNGGANYLVTLVNAAGSITPAALTLAATTDSRVYDGTTGSAGAVTVRGLKGADTVTGLAQSFDSRNAGSRTLSVNGGYTIDDGNAGGNYSVTLATAAGSISPAALTLSATTDSRGYDATTASTAAVTARGLQAGDTIANLSQSFDSANAGTRTLTVNGGYTINDGNGGGNYAVSRASAAGSITPTALNVTYTANSATSVYGDAPAATGGTVTFAGLQGGDTAAGVLAGTASFATAVTARSAVGAYAIAGGGLAASSANYQVAFSQAAGNATAYAVTPRPITITADAQSRAAGADNPALTYAVAFTGTAQGGKPGLVNGDQLTGALLTDATRSSSKGLYAIQQGSLAASANYRVTYVGADLTVGDTTAPPPPPPAPATSGSSLLQVNLAAPIHQITQGANLPYIPADPAAPDARQAIETAAKPVIFIATAVDPEPLTRPLPVHENVTTNGDAGQWQAEPTNR